MISKSSICFLLVNAGFLWAYPQGLPLDNWTPQLYQPSYNLNAESERPVREVPEKTDNDFSENIPQEQHLEQAPQNDYSPGFYPINKPNEFVPEPQHTMGKDPQGDYHHNNPNEFIQEPQHIPERAPPNSYPLGPYPIDNQNHLIQHQNSMGQVPPNGYPTGPYSLDKPNEFIQEQNSAATDYPSMPYMENKPNLFVPEPQFVMGKVPPGGYPLPLNKPNEFIPEPQFMGRIPPRDYPLGPFYPNKLNDFPEPQRRKGKVIFESSLKTRKTLISPYASDVWRPMNIPGMFPATQILEQDNIVQVEDF